MGKVGAFLPCGILILMGCSETPLAKKKVNCLMPGLKAKPLPVNPLTQDTKRILGGVSVAKNTDDPRVKSTVSLGGCTAVIVADKLVLTAAHCLKSGPPTVIFDWDMRDSQSGKRIRAKSYKTHPKFSIPHYDVAYIVLGESIPNGYAPIPIWTESSKLTPKKSEVTLMGYGLTTDGGSPSQHLRSVAIPFKGMAKGYIGLILLGPIPKKGACHGDSGGPGFYTDPDSGEHALFGLTSGFFPQFFPEVNPKDGCNTGAVVYTEVQAHRQWIEENSGIKLTPFTPKGGGKPGSPSGNEASNDEGNTGNVGSEGNKGASQPSGEKEDGC